MLLSFRIGGGWLNIGEEILAATMLEMLAFS